MQFGLNTIAGIAGAVIGYMFGGWSMLLQTFLLVIALDYVTGVAASVKRGKGLNSRKGLWGIAQKGVMLLIVMIGHRFDLLLGTDMFMTAFIYFYLSNELISITENCGRLGVPLPGRIRRLIEVLRNEEEERK